MNPQWVIAIASSIAALGILGVIYQCYNAFNQLKSDHERSRRERAIDLLCNWDQGLTHNGSAARKFAETLSFEQSKSLLKQEEFEVNDKHYGLFLGILSPFSAQIRDGNKPENGIIIVSERESSEVRWAVISYLNQLETTLSAVRHNVADKTMIYEQFKYLVSPSDGYYILKDFRHAAGGKAVFPSIEEFANELKNENEDISKGKPPVA